MVPSGEGEGQVEFGWTGGGVILTDESRVDALQEICHKTRNIDQRSLHGVSSWNKCSHYQLGPFYTP